VTNKGVGSFEVHESGQGTSSIAFDCRVVAKRKGYEMDRLVDVTERFKAEKAAAARPPAIPGRSIQQIRSRGLGPAGTTKSGLTGPVVQ
jgi:hypothetical protein